MDIDGVINIVPVPTGDPPDAALYQKIESEAVAVNVTAPGPQRDPEVGTGGVVIFIVAVTGVRELNIRYLMPVHNKSLLMTGKE